VLLADEPTGDLDERNAWAVFELLERLHRAHGLTSLNRDAQPGAGRTVRPDPGLEHGVLRTRKDLSRRGSRRRFERAGTLREK
jgi:hypothetical protein